VENTKSTIGFYAAGLLFLALSMFFLWNNNYIIFIVPAGLMAIYFAIFHTQTTFLSLFFLVPISVNIEEYVEGFGLYLPTEPLLFGMMILLLLFHLHKPVFPNHIWRKPIILAVVFYLVWIVITSITSTHPIVSMKFLLAKLWFIIPVLFYGTSVFHQKKNIVIFLWLFTSGMIIAMIYTLVSHAGYGFGEKEGHWVMSPLFKDHTIYGAMVAFVVPLLFGLYFHKKHTPLVQAVLLGMMTINFIALYFSYTRAAWLSIVAALCVWLVIWLRIKFTILLGTAIMLGIIVFFSWTSIEQSLAKNKSEHTTEEFGERLQSAANVTTDASNLERINRWSCAIDMFVERPVFGFGPGTYAFEYARFQKPENLTIISTNFGDMGNAHSEYLGPLAEMGLMGLLSMLALVAAIFYQGITLYIDFPTEQRELRILILAMNLALVTYFVHGILNNYLDTDKASVPIWAICACFLALDHRLKTGEIEK
jgi:O-antigen ligase